MLISILWLVAAAALLVALAAWRQARRTAARLEHVSQLYWDLTYQQGELRAQMRGSAPDAASPPDPRPASGGRSADAFVPIATLKR